MNDHLDSSLQTGQIEEERWPGLVQFCLEVQTNQCRTFSEETRSSEIIKATLIHLPTAQWGFLIIVKPQIKALINHLRTTNEI